LGAEVSVALLTTEFEKLGLRVGEKHLLEVLKADQNIGGIILNAAGVFDVVKSKNISRQTLLKLNSKDREDADLNAKIPNVYYHDQSRCTQLKAKESLNTKWNQIK
jgi:hypothetical protein